MLGMTWGDISPWIFYDMGLPLLPVSYTHLTLPTN